MTELFLTLVFHRKMGYGDGTLVSYETKVQLLATDVSVLVTMKNAAKCDT